MAPSFLSSDLLAPAALVAVFSLFLAYSLSLVLLGGGGLGAGNRSTCGQCLFSAYIRLGRLRNLLCSSCDRWQRRYPTANTCQVPFFKSLSDVYTFVFGYECEGLFVEVGAYDGESFSNTSGLADLGWRGHYIEPIPRFAAVAAARHASSAPRVQVHTLCICEKDGEEVRLSTAGPFSSGVEDEIASVAASKMSEALGAMGWEHEADSQRVVTKGKALNTFFTEQGIQPGEVDVLVRAPPPLQASTRLCALAAQAAHPPLTPPPNSPRRLLTRRALKRPFCAALTLQSGRPGW